MNLLQELSIICEFKDTKGEVKENLWYFFDTNSKKIVGHYNFMHNDTAQEMLIKWIKEDPKEFQGKTVVIKQGKWLIANGIKDHDQTSLPSRLMK